MYLLGISCFYHDSSATLLSDGRVVAAAAEERFTRKKHDTSFPQNAVKYCLSEAGIKIGDVDYVGFYEKPLLKFERVLYSHVDMFPRSFDTFYRAMPSWINEKLRIPGIVKKKTGYKKDILFIDHHLAHAASSYLVSPFDESAILTVDGVGEWTTTSLGYGQGNNIKLFKQIQFPHSLGLLYSAATAHLGFSVNNSEYKVMGLSPYGDRSDANPFYEKFKKVIDIKEDGSFELDMEYFVYHYKMSMPSDKYVKEFGPIRKKESEVTQRHKDIAAALQMVTEDAIYAMLRFLHKETGSDNVCLAGGCALNSVANGKILKKTPFKNIYIQPAAGDEGTSMGAASYVYNTILGKERKYVLDTAYLGPHYTASEIRGYMDGNSIKYSEYPSDKALVEGVSSLIFENNVIGWFQGRMEWGPRALGSRSILSNPTNPAMQDILNLKVKHREKFRPFAPVVCVDDAMDYFECDEPIPTPTDFMLMVYPIKEEKRMQLPAVTHVDGSGRLQTIRREHNALYYDLIKAFGRLSGVPILVNTSYNIRGEPVVCTPKDAYRCMMGTGIDYLVMGRFLVRRDDNLKDAWESEEYAKD
jgi:carbamoyltransferase